MKKHAGFTLLELITVVIIVAVLVTMAISYYKRAVENMRMTEVISLMGVEIAAQERFMLLKRHYTKHWHMLDTAPVQVRRAYAENNYSNGVENTVFFTRGKKHNGDPASGFQMYFENIGQSWFVTADRVGDGDFKYTLIRPFDSEQVFCLPGNDETNSINVCLGFMGVDDVSELPRDPRLSAKL